MAKLSKCCFESFHGNIDRRVLFKFREIRANGKSVISCIIYLTKKFRLAVQLSLLHELCPKSARASPRHCTQSAPAFIEIGSLSAEL